MAQEVPKIGPVDLVGWLTQGVCAIRAASYRTWA
jgi:hypothetical protein